MTRETIEYLDKLRAWYLRPAAAEALPAPPAGTIGQTVTKPCSPDALGRAGLPQGITQDTAQCLATQGRRHSSRGRGIIASRGKADEFATPNHTAGDANPRRGEDLPATRPVNAKGIFLPASRAVGGDDPVQSSCVQFFGKGTTPQRG